MSASHPWRTPIDAHDDQQGALRAPAALWLSREGRWFHDGQAVAHERLCALLDRSIQVKDGALVVSTGIDVMPFRCEDAPMRVVSLDPGAGTMLLHSGSAVPFPSSVHIDQHGVIRCVVAVGTGHLWARFERNPALAFAAAVVSEQQALLHGRHVTIDAQDLANDWTIPLTAHTTERRFL
jgi:hypothetical protein